MPAFEDDSKCAMSYQVLPTELKFPHRLHIVPVFDLILQRPGQVTRGAQASLRVSKCSFLLREAGAAAAAAGMFTPSSTRHGLPS